MGPILGNGANSMADALTKQEVDSFFRCLRHIIGSGFGYTTLIPRCLVFWDLFLLVVWTSFLINITLPVPDKKKRRKELQLR